MIRGDPGRGRSIRQMFGDIAGRYDLLNRLITFGQDLSWRREAIERLALAPGAKVVDVGCGTGDMAYEVLRQQPEANVFACDFTPKMITVGRARGTPERLNWLLADVQRLPFAAETFDAACSGFLLRNVTDVNATLGEQARVLKPEGQLIALDTSPGEAGWLTPLRDFHLKAIIPLLGRLLVRDASAYRYLPTSTRAFLSAESLAQKLRRAGLKGVGFTRRMLGNAAIHWGRKAG
jgi:demethylmenaquinone methyltransferase/2-methoxy-6-polyprenyl-1,4-benzoquinol methylase